MALYSGIDLHSNNSYVVVSDEEDRILLEKRMTNDLGTIGRALEPFHEELFGVAVESTFNWYWLVDGLMDLGYQLHLVNTSAVKQYEGLKSPTTATMLDGWHTCFGSASCPPVTSILARSARYGICCADVASWSSRRWRLCWRGGGFCRAWARASFVVP